MYGESITTLGKNSGIYLAFTILVVSAPSIYAVAAPDEAGMAGNAGPLTVVSATLRQPSAQIRLYVKTEAAWTLKDLEKESGRSLCIKFRYSDERTARAKICLRRSKRGGGARLVRVKLSASGEPVAWRAISAAVKHPTLRTVKATFLPSEDGMKAGRLRWQVVSSWSGSGCQTTTEPTDGCSGSFPEQGTVLARISGVQPVGCKRGGSPYRSSGPRNRKAVALTFDDGPSPYTGSVLRTLKRYGAKATFFVLGDQMPGRTSLLRSMVRNGHEIGNHSLNHPIYPSYGQLVMTSARIKQAANFKPCLFRPPYGAVNASLISRVLQAGMMTINWDVDPQDWTTPGTGAIVSRVLGTARRGSIILLHDGGGPRGQTVAALPSILRSLSSRGYSFLTVTKLLGHDEILGKAR